MSRSGRMVTLVLISNGFTQLADSVTVKVWPAMVRASLWPARLPVRLTFCSVPLMSARASILIRVWPRGPSLTVMVSSALP